MTSSARWATSGARWRLDPHHFKALDGLGQIMREIGQKKAALKAFKQLLDVHPYWSGAKQAVEELEREVDGQGI